MAECRDEADELAGFEVEAIGKGAELLGSLVEEVEGLRG
jgi:hypothetical protein